MELFQIILMGTLTGFVFASYKFTRDEIALIRDEMKQREIFHREDMRSMDSKWERLFEKLSLKEQGKV